MYGVQAGRATTRHTILSQEAEVQEATMMLSMNSYPTPLQFPTVQEPFRESASRTSYQSYAQMNGDRHQPRRKNTSKPREPEFKSSEPERQSKTDRRHPSELKPLPVREKAQDTPHGQSRKLKPYVYVNPDEESLYDWSDTKYEASDDTPLLLLRRFPLVPLMAAALVLSHPL